MSDTATDIAVAPKRRNGNAAQAHRVAFFRNWLDDPIKVGSIMPSGRMLANRMVTGLRPGSTIIELGAGTGTLTDAIRNAGVRDQHLHLVEQSQDFAHILQRRFPQAQVHCVDADSLVETLPQLVGKVDCIVSGLPILWFEREKKLAILRAIFTMLGPDGFLQQFTYVGAPPIGLGLIRELRLTATLVGFAPLNFPPAFVYQIRQRPLSIGN